YSHYSSYLFEARLIYSNVGGVQCGDYHQLTLSLNDLEPTKTERKLIKIVDFMGRETQFTPNTPLIYLYDDGTIEKKYIGE
ncbi:MAG: hypothetical protein KDC84_15930, partial [Crocinitomicaceae bacterium]|nr:hypothetical protein [Crocinitomicaceae bacterium]